VIQDLLTGWAELNAAYPGYAEAELYYDGNPEEVFSDPRIRDLVARSGERYRFNFAKTPVNVRASRLNLAAITVPGSEAVTAELDSVLEANDMDVHFPDTFLRTFEYGDSYLMAWPTPDVDPNAPVMGSQLDVELQSAGVEITYHSPKHTRVIYDRENERRKAFALRRWSIMVGTEKAWRVDLWYTDRVEQWVSVVGGDVESPSGWQTYAEGEAGPEDWILPNEFGEIPFFHFRTELPYGVPVHKAGYGCQDAINKLLITELTTVDSHGWPQRYQLLDKDAELDSAHDSPDWESDDGAPADGQVTAGGTSSGLRMGPATIATLTGAKSVGQFPAADPSVFMDPAQVFVRMMAQITETPFHAFDPSGDVPSGESLRVAESPLVKQIVRYGTMFRSPLTELSGFILKIKGIRAVKVEIRWDAPQSATGVDDWTIIAAKQSAGVPTDQTLIEAGYDSEQVARWLDEQAEAMSLANRVALLGQIGAAVQSIGSGVALGVLSAEEASAAISMVLDQTTTVNTEPA
jgi:hypothetical protein